MQAPNWQNKNSCDLQSILKVLVHFGRGIDNNIGGCSHLEFWKNTENSMPPGEYQCYVLSWTVNGLTIYFQKRVCKRVYE